MVIRVAGSGVSQTAHCDLIMFPRDINLPCLIEVKTSSQEKWVFKWQTQSTKEEILELKKQAQQYGLRGVLAVKFMRKPWIFMDVELIDDHFVLHPEETGDFTFL